MALAAEIYESTLFAESVDESCQKVITLIQDRELPAKATNQICSLLVQSWDNDRFEELFSALADSEDAGARTAVLDTLQPPALAGFDKAFNCSYTHHRARDAFLDYLDVWSALRVKFSLLEKEPKYSYCGTIVQSSCAGKSRLAKE